MASPNFFLSLYRKLNIMSELKFRVQPYGSGGDYYSIEYRKEITGFWLFLNFLIPWNLLCRTFHIGLLSSYPNKYHPVLYRNFDEAVRDAEKYKNNPKLMEDFIKREQEEYERIYKQCESYFISKNKSKVI